MANAITFTPLLSILLLSLISLSTAITTATLPLTLTQLTTTTPQQPLDIYQHLTHLATASLARARHLKNPKPTGTTPLTSHSYGGYSVSLKFGTPPQTMPFVMDTGSDFVWFPCTANYLCKDCSSPIPTFIPKLSSTVRVVGCLNPKCGWIHNPDTQLRCPDCTDNPSNCTQACPPYLIIYGSGSTGGVALLDTLDLNYEKVPGFLVGCSLFSAKQPAGIAGFGRGESSVPSQLGLSKFSYCLLSRQFDDSPVSSLMNLTGKSSSGEKLAGTRYTPFLKNPKVPARKAFSVYYYIGLNEIRVAGKKVNIPNRVLSEPDHYTGFGGSIVDSGTTFTYMGREIFEPLARAIETRVSEYGRAKEIETLTGLRPCFNISGHKIVSLPSLEFHFKGGAKMELPLENYFSIAGKAEVVCMTIVTDPLGQETRGGPKVILGSFQQQNYNVEYDLKHNRFGFIKHKCA